MKVWLVGATGMLGSCVKRILDGIDAPVLTTSHGGLDITDAAAVNEFGAQGFTHIINCAAYTAVDAAESEPDRAFAVNGDGVRNLARTAVESKAVLVHVSTDYVFDGKAQSPYDEQAPCAPAGVYGRSKLAGEEAIREVTANFAQPAYIVRTAWLFGPGGRNFVATMLRLVRERDSLRVVADQRGRPTYTTDLAQALLQVSGVTGTAAPAGLYHFANSGETTWYGLAEATRQAAIRRLGSVACERIEPIATADYPTPAARPAYSVLSTAKIERTLKSPPRPWQAGLDAYVDTILQQESTDA